MKWDGHTHTPFCPHGSKDSLDEYIEAAILQGFTCYSITEHAPLPEPFVDPVPLQDSSMAIDVLEEYLEHGRQIKEKYKPYIEIKVGLEIDYLLGFESETTAFLNRYGPFLDDALLSLHFLPLGHEWVCLDYSPESFLKIVEHIGNVDQVYRYYYQVLHQAVLSNLGPYKPKRIGHLTLIEKFKKKYPSVDQDIWWSEALKVLSEVKRNEYQLDFNTAGLLKPLCRDIYPSYHVLESALQLGIPFVYGSDAHQAKHVGYAYEEYTKRYL